MMKVKKSLNSNWKDGWIGNAVSMAVVALQGALSRVKVSVVKSFSLWHYWIKCVRLNNLHMMRFPFYSVGKVIRKRWGMLSVDSRSFFWRRMAQGFMTYFFYFFFGQSYFSCDFYFHILYLLRASLKAFIKSWSLYYIAPPHTYFLVWLICLQSSLIATNCTCTVCERN